MQVQLWGVRGGIASCASDTCQHGGNTACVAVRSSSGRLLVLDAGTGIRGLGQCLIEQSASRTAITELSIVLSHFHWDHVQGLPFFAPLWSDRFAVRFYADAAAERIEQWVSRQFEAPFFPVPITQAKADIQFCALPPNRKIAGFEVTPFAQLHPGGSTGFRIQEGSSVLVYATDAEGGQPLTDAELLRQAHGANLLILDAQYTPEESPERAGWGHGDWRRCCSVAQQAGVERLLLFHHDPARTDEQLTQIAAQARALFPETVAAREGMSFEL